MGGADAIPHCVPLQGYSLPQCKGFLPVSLGCLLLSDLRGCPGPASLSLAPREVLAGPTGQAMLPGLPAGGSTQLSTRTGGSACLHQLLFLLLPLPLCVCAQTPFSKHFPIFMLFGGLTWACSYLNGRNFKPVESMSAEYKAAEAKNINVSCCSS